MFARLLAAVAVATGACPLLAAPILSVSTVNVSTSPQNNGASQTSEPISGGAGTLAFTQTVGGPQQVSSGNSATLVNYGQISGSSPSGVTNAQVNGFDLSIGVTIAASGNVGTIDLGGTGVGGINGGFSSITIDNQLTSLRFNGVPIPNVNLNSQGSVPVAVFSIIFPSTFPFDPLTSYNYLEFEIRDDNNGDTHNTSGLSLVFLGSALARNETFFDTYGNIYTVRNTLISDAPIPPIPQRQFVGAVPEPASVVVFGLGVVAVGWVRRRARAAA